MVNHQLLQKIIKMSVECSERTDFVLSWTSMFIFATFWEILLPSSGKEWDELVEQIKSALMLDFVMDNTASMLFVQAAYVSHISDWMMCLLPILL